MSEPTEATAPGVKCPTCFAIINRKPWADGRFLCSKCRKATRNPLPLDADTTSVPDGPPAPPKTTTPAIALSTPATTTESFPSKRRRSAPQPSAPLQSIKESRPKRAKIKRPVTDDDTDDHNSDSANQPAPMACGKLVWVRYSNYPPWPACVVSEKSKSRSIIRHKRPNTCLVQFLSSNDFAWVGSKLEDFETNFVKYSKSRTPEFCAAASIGIRRLALRNVKRKGPEITARLLLLSETRQACSMPASSSSAPASSSATTTPQVAVMRPPLAPTPSATATVPTPASSASSRRSQISAKPLSVRDLGDSCSSDNDAAAPSSSSSRPRPSNTKRRQRMRSSSSKAAHDSLSDSGSDTADDMESLRAKRNKALANGMVFGVSQTVEQVLSRREQDGKAQLLVKYFGKSYLHVDWIDEELMLDTQSGKRKLKRYFQIKEQADEDNVAGEPVTDELFDPEFVQIERIADSRQTTREGKVIVEYMVKWRGLGYEDCTWELSSDIQDDNAINTYLERQKLARQKFVEYVPAPEDYVEGTPTLDTIGRAGHALMKHQVEGVQWLVKRWFHHNNSLLADEMGLGKTAQASVLLDYIGCHVQKSRGPFIVVAPLSTLAHWQREFEQWTGLSVLMYRGKAEGRSIIRQHDWKWPDCANDRYKFDVLLTDYATLRVDHKCFLKVRWKVLIVDEAQSIKNHESKLHLCLHQLNTDHRVLLTGTPLQNNTAELWSLMSFLEPKRFGSLQTFQEAYGNIESKSDVQALQELVRPQMLRRLKQEVALSLPGKEETLVEVEMTSTQKKFYRALYERNRAYLSKGCKTGNAPRLNNVAMQLRKCCNHIFLLKGIEDRVTESKELHYDIVKMVSSRDQQAADDKKKKEPASTNSSDPTAPAEPEKVVPNPADTVPVAEPESLHLPDGMTMQAAHLVYSSGKMVLLHKLLVKLRADKHRVLIFSQFRVMLDLIERYLNCMEYPHERIDGTISGNSRQAAIDRFMDNSQDVFVFLLTTRAGGVGVNLTAADVVIIFDSDWNPQNDIQAQARCHRIGQTQDVQVYRLITRGTYEEHLFAQANRKLGLHYTLLGTIEGAKENLSEMSANDVEKMLRLGCGSAVLDEDDEETRKFCEEDIDQILSSKSRVLRYSTANQEGATSKAKFEVQVGDNLINVDDPDFWKKVLPTLDPVRSLSRGLQDLLAHHAIDNPPAPQTTADGELPPPIKPPDTQEDKSQKRLRRHQLQSMIKSFLQQLDILIDEYIESLLEGQDVSDQKEPLLRLLQTVVECKLFTESVQQRMQSMIQQVLKPTRKRKQMDTDREKALSAQDSSSADDGEDSGSNRPRRRRRTNDGEFEYEVFGPESDVERENPQETKKVLYGFGALAEDSSDEDRWSKMPFKCGMGCNKAYKTRYALVSHFVREHIGFEDDIKALSQTQLACNFGVHAPITPVTQVVASYDKVQAQPSSSHRPLPPQLDKRVEIKAPGRTQTPTSPISMDAASDDDPNAQTTAKAFIPFTSTELMPKCPQPIPIKYVIHDEERSRSMSVNVQFVTFDSQLARCSRKNCVRVVPRRPSQIPATPITAPTASAASKETPTPTPTPTPMQLDSPDKAQAPSQPPTEENPVATESAVSETLATNSTEGATPNPPETTATDPPIEPAADTQPAPSKETPSEASVDTTTPTAMDTSMAAEQPPKPASTATEEPTSTAPTIPENELKRTKQSIDKSKVATLTPSLALTAPANTDEEFRKFCHFLISPDDHNQAIMLLQDCMVQQDIRYATKLNGILGSFIRTMSIKRLHLRARCSRFFTAIDQTHAEAMLSGWEKVHAFVSILIKGGSFSQPPIPAPPSRQLPSIHPSPSTTPVSQPSPAPSRPQQRELSSQSMSAIRDAILTQDMYSKKPGLLDASEFFGIPPLRPSTASSSRSARESSQSHDKSSSQRSWHFSAGSKSSGPRETLVFTEEQLQSLPFAMPTRQEASWVDAFEITPLHSETEGRFVAYPSVGSVAGAQPLWISGSRDSTTVLVTKNPSAGMPPYTPPWVASVEQPAPNPYAALRVPTAWVGGDF